MRVISGTARGRKLKEPRGLDIRPTGNKVKESVFNIIQFDIEGRRVLDLYAGTGQLGIEALSRGARNVVFVDSNPDAVKLMKANIELCGFSGAATVYKCDALDYLEHDGTFDLIFLDPPYNTALAGETVRKIIEFDKIVTNGIIVCETSVGSPTPPASPPYHIRKEYIYGCAKITRYVRE